MMGTGRQACQGSGTLTFNGSGLLTFNELGLQSSFIRADFSRPLRREPPREERCVHARNIGDFQEITVRGIGGRHRRRAAAHRNGHGRAEAQARGHGQERDQLAASGASYRAAYHFTVPDQWKNDPQRPVWIDGEYHYYYLYNADYFTGAVGTAWRLATTEDLVSFTDRGVAAPKNTTSNGDLWSGSAVVDTGNTAGFGAGAVVVIVTMSPGGGTDSQAQFLYYSTDGGLTFTNHGTAPSCPTPASPTSATPR
jgi:hypothetical protein